MSTSAKSLGEIVEKLAVDESLPQVHPVLLDVDHRTPCPLMISQCADEGSTRLKRYGKGWVIRRASVRRG